MKNYNKLLPKYKQFNVDWLLGTVCNYSCSYCSPGLHDGRYKFIDIKLAKNLLKKLVQKHKDKKLIFIISGGEPTLWADLPEFMDAAKKNNAEVQLITNGSKSINWWYEFSNLIDLAVISFHWEFASPNHIEKVCKTIRANHNTHVKVNILVKIGKFEESYALAEKLHKNVPGILIELRPIRKHHGMYLIDYTDEQLERLKNKNRFGSFHRSNKYQRIFNDYGELFNPDMSILKKENCWKGWECHIGLESLKIMPDGNIYRGTCETGGVIGNVSGEIELPTKPIICDKDFCRCVTDIRTTKKRVQNG